MNAATSMSAPSVGATPMKTKLLTLVRSSRR